MTQRVFQGKDVSLYPWVLTESEKEYVREFNGKKYINKSQNRSSKRFWDLLWYARHELILMGASP